MYCDIDQLVRDAKVCLDENITSEALEALGDTDTLTLNDIIRSKIEPAAKAVLERADRSLLDGGKALSGAVVWQSGQEGYGAGRIALPADFLRLLVFKMSDWSRPVVTAIGDDSPLYAMQSSRYGGVRGNAQRPVVAITHSHPYSDNDSLTLEFYSCEGGAGVHVENARYIAVPKVSGNAIAIGHHLRDAVVYRIAGMAAMTVGAVDIAGILMQESNGMAGIATPSVQQQQ